MQRRTTTQKIHSALSNNLLQIIKAECHYKSSSRIDKISKERFQEIFDFLCKSGVFTDAIGWHFEKDYRSGSYILETGRANPNSEIIIEVYLDVGEGVGGEDIERTLLFIEEE